MVLERSGRGSEIVNGVLRPLEVASGCDILAARRAATVAPDVLGETARVDTEEMEVPARAEIRA